MKTIGFNLAIVLFLSATVCTGLRAETIEIGGDTGPTIELIQVGDEWDFFRGKAAPSDPADAWYTQMDFSYPGWESGPSGFGYGDGDDATVLNDMRYSYHTVYVRKVFDASGLTPNYVLQFEIDYDDGFIVYLNGQYKDSRNSDRGSSGALGANHEAGTPITITLGAAGEFNEGANLIAIEGLNVNLDSSDFSLIPALRAIPDSKVILTEDTTWSGDYLIKSPVVVPEGVVLTIEPGSVIMFQNGAGITVNGQLVADGTQAEPIQFTRDTAGTVWERLLFVNAEDSRLTNCIIEYSTCDGDHKDYYDTDCDPETPFPSRDYFQAVTAVASHLDITDCVFQNLPNDGDAIAIISDDPDNPGEASANIVGCQFLFIGQGIHTRYAYVLIKDCYFTGHDGDNDDIDLYGESDPVPLVLNNIMINPHHDDMINPTRCSAVMVGNIIAGCDDHGVVLRDKSYPVLINNLIYNCSSAGVAVQNQCDALIANNTIVNCNRGVRFFDHTGRWGPPYCLYPGSGKATIANCIIRDCSTPFELSDTSYSGDRGSYATVKYCDVEGGQAASSVGSNSILTWGPGNIDVDPAFVNQAGGDFHLKSQAGRWDSAAEAWVQDSTHSPCIDAGDPADDNWMEELWPHGGVINMGAYGGTPEASMSIDPVGHIADLDHDGVVSLEDITRLAADWRRQRKLLDTDLDHDGVVGVADIAILAEGWLWEQP